MDVIRYKWSTEDLIHFINFNHWFFLLERNPLDLASLLYLTVNHQHLIYFRNSRSNLWLWTRTTPQAESSYFSSSFHLPKIIFFSILFQSSPPPPSKLKNVSSSTTQNWQEQRSKYQNNLVLQQQQEQNQIPQI